MASEAIRVDPDDLRPLDDERHIAENAALAIEHGRRPNHDGTGLALRGGRHWKKQRGDDEHSNAMHRLLLSRSSDLAIAVSNSGIVP